MFSFSSKTKHLERFAAYPNRFRFFFLLNDRWAEGKVMSATTFSVNGEILHTNQLKSYIIGYRNGQFVHGSKSFFFYPDEIIDMDIQPSPETLSLTHAELTAGNDLFAIEIDKSPIFTGRHYYKTTITNRSGEKARVLRFAGVEPNVKDTFALNTVTNAFYSESEFNNWYMDTADSWIAPGQQVFDPINYGGDGTWWIFEAELESGKRFWFCS